MKLLLIMNPGSRSGKGQRLWHTWESGLRDAGIAFERVQTERAGHAFALAREANGCDTVVAAGGDGTINEVLDGVMQSGNPALRMGVLYSGTSPDFCRFHGIPVDPRAALATLVAGRVRQVDVARIVYAAGTRGTCTAYFGCGCNIGMGAAVARVSNRIRRFTGDTLGTGLAVLRAALSNRAADLELEIDGVRECLPHTNNLSVLKSPYIASGLKLNLALEPDDGTLALIAVAGKGRLGLCKTLPGFYSGRAASAPGVLVQHCARVAVRAAAPQEIEFDGDPRGFLPVEIEVQPKALNLIGKCHE